MKVIVLGAGAIGAYYGGQLARARHEVTLYARGENLAAIREHGLEIKTPEGSTVVRVAATDRVEELGAADFAILGVKSYSLDSIGPVVKQVAGKDTAIVPFLNGVETTDRLIELGVPRSALLGGVTRISVARVKPGVVERRGATLGVRARKLDAEAARALEPSLNPVFRHAIHWPDIASVSNPLAVTRAYAARFAALGGVVVKGDARSLHRAASRAAPWALCASNHSADVCCNAQCRKSSTSRAPAASHSQPTKLRRRSVRSTHYRRAPSQAFCWM